MKDKKLIVGAINWDCSLSEDKFFGYYTSKVLSPKKYRLITPYYADILGENKAINHERTIEEYEREMQYAIDAGIDYFAYCWYGESPKKQDINWQCNLWELSYARKMHLKSRLKNKLKMCAIIGVGAKEKEYTEGELKDLAIQMQEDHYQYIEGRPLVYVLNAHKNKLTELVSKACEECGTLNPFFVNMYGGPYAECKAELARADALSAYGFAIYADNYDEFITGLLEDMDEKFKINSSVIPRFSLGWNPSPRIDNPVPWYGYPVGKYVENVTPEDIRKGAQRFGDWINKNTGSIDLGHILLFAWNEFEEGAHICPTYDKEGKGIDMERYDTVKEVIAKWKEKL